MTTKRPISEHAHFIVDEQLSLKLGHDGKRAVSQTSIETEGNKKCVVLTSLRAASEMIDHIKSRTAYKLLLYSRSAYLPGIHDRCWAGGALS